MERTKCCFCFDLKTGTLAVGIFTVVTRMMVLVAFAVMLGLSQRDNNANLETLDVIYSVVIGECALSVLFGILLIIGVQKTIRGLFIPWTVLAALDIGSNVYMFFGSLFGINGALAIAQTFAYLIGATFLVYQFWCVVSYYRSLSAQNILYQNFKDEGIPSAPVNLERTTENVI